MSKKIEIYGFSGKLGTGKNFIAEKIFLPMMPQKQTLVMAFADELKIEGIVKDNLDRTKVFGEKDEFTRKALQTRGTELGRMKYGEQIWVNFLREWILAYSARGVERFIITDLRFPNEFQFIKDMGGVTFKVNAPKRNLARLQKEANTAGVKIETISSHSSETALDNQNGFDYIINNDPEDNAFVQIRNIVFDTLKEHEEELVIFSDLDDTICECHIYYQNIIDLTKTIIKKNLNTTMRDEELNVMFDESFEKHNGDYFRVPFYREKFADSLISVLEDFSSLFKTDTVLSDLEHQVFKLGMDVFDYDYKALSGSIDALRYMQTFSKVVIFTIGDRAEQVKKISSLGLVDLSFEIFDHKDETLFRNLKKKYKAKRHVMIGDSYHRDILPSMNVGFDLVVKIDKTIVGRDTKENFYGAKSLKDASVFVENFFKIEEPIHA
jgi:FMN phosphatase YigB (HAD superfamily)